MAIRISELTSLSADLAQSDALPIVDLSAAETKQVSVGDLIVIGISGAPSGFIDLGKLDQNSTTKLNASVLDLTGVASGVYGAANTVAQFIVNGQGLITTATGVPIVITASSVTGLAAVATSGTYASLTGLPTLGSLSSQDANSVVISGGTISGVNFVSGNVTISGGTISGITDLAVEDGGTGASDAATARTNLGLAIGTDVQAYSSVLSDIAAQFDEGDEIVYASASGVVSATSFTSFARSIVSGSTAAEVRGTLGLGSISTQDAGSVAISGGTISGISLSSSSVDISGGVISGITDLAIADGGTGASDAATARTNLGLAIGTDVQAYSQVLAAIANEFNDADEIVYASASGVVSATPFTSVGRNIVGQTAASGVRDAIGLGSIALQNADSVLISGGTISGITDLAIEDGGTGASTASGARTNLGLAIGSDVQAYNAGLASIAGLSTSTDQLIYTTAANTYATTNITAYSRGLLASGNSAQDARTVLGLGILSTKNLVASGDVASGAIFGTAIAPGSIIAGSYEVQSITTDDIQDSAITSVKIVDSGVTETKIADNTTTIVGNGAPVSIGAFIGQRYFDNINKLDYTWDGSAWERGAGIASISFTESTPISFVVNYPDNVSADIDVSFEDQAANTFLAGPVSGVDASPSFRTIEPVDLPIATASGVGAVFPGAGLQVAANGSIGHSNTVLPGTYAGPITIDSEGHITSVQTSLSATDIPELDASKITTGTFSSDFLAPNSVTANQLADYGIAQVSESAPTPEFAGQWWINPNDRSAYIWVGEVTPVPNGYWLNLGYGSPTQINLRFGGTYNASGNTVESINSYGIEAGLTVGQALSAPNSSNNGVYLICTSSGVGTAPAPSGTLSIGNWVLSQGVGATWTKVALSSAVAGVADQDVLVDGAALTPAASGVASQEDLNESIWARVQIANGSTAGIVRASSEIAVASGTGSMSISTIDDGTY